MSTHYDNLRCVCLDCGATFLTTVNLSRYDKINVATLTVYAKRAGWATDKSGRYVTRCASCTAALGEETTGFTGSRWRD